MSVWLRCRCAMISTQLCELGVCGENGRIVSPVRVKRSSTLAGRIPRSVVGLQERGMGDLG